MKTAEALAENASLRSLLAAQSEVMQRTRALLEEVTQLNENARGLDAVSRAVLGMEQVGERT